MFKGRAFMNDPLAPNATVSSSISRPVSLLPPVPVVTGAGKWHLATIAAGCVLIATFFLPLGDLTKWSTSTEVPGKIVVEMSRRPGRIGWRSLPEAVVLGAYFVSLVILPHLWGLLMVLYSLGSLLDLRWLRRVPHALGAVIGVALGVTAVVGVALYLPRFLSYLKGGGAQYYVALVLMSIIMLFAVLGVLYAMLAIRRGGWAYLYHGFAGAGVLVFVFTSMTGVLVLAVGWRIVGLTGLTVTWFFSCLLLFSRIGEARALTGLTWRRTLWYLLTLRLHKASPPVGLCPKCGYYLYGLREQRCPECGRPFSFEEVQATPETLGFAGEPSVFHGSLSEP